jgi:23S rRNA pseudouridine2605 synthase
MAEPSITPSEGTRLQAYLAHAGVASRRACERFILDGRVAINGKTASELGVRVKSGDSVSLDGKLLEPEGRKRYIILNKPAGYLSAMADPEGRPLAVDLLKGVDERVYNVGRLDQWSSGLLLFTNDGDLAALLVHPSGGIEKEYEIVADGPLGEDFFDAFRAGMEIDGVVYRAAFAQRTGALSVRVILVEGKNREIRRVLERFGRKAILLKRVRIGPIALGELPEGSFRELSMTEIESLRSRGKKAR